MAQIEIPKSWREQVCAILVSDDENLIRWDPTGRKRYDAMPGCHWAYEAHEALRTFLSAACPTGCLCVMDEPPGETYEFYFTFKGQRLYGKILLRLDRKRIVIFSAHLPLQPKLRCE